MWIATKFGFLSIVEKPADVGTPFLTVRARARGDLAALLGALPVKRRPKILRDNGADYLFRARVRRGVVAKLLSDAVMAVDYPNFKDAVRREHGPKREAIYHRVWAALLDLERPRPFASMFGRTAA